MKIKDHKSLGKLVEHFGVERLLAALPQTETRKALGLVSVKEVSDATGLNYETFRSKMKSGEIPYPEVQLLRRRYFTREQANSILENASFEIDLGNT